MRTSVVILPDLSWAGTRDLFRRAEDLGFAVAWTYDHLSWRTLRDGPWFGAVPLLAAAADATTSIRLGPLVATPNFRHPVTFAKEIVTLDDISGGRLELGLGAGGPGPDASVLGTPPADRTGRFFDFVSLTDALLRHPVHTAETSHYQAVDARTVPGCVQQPRVPFTVAGVGPRALAVAVAFAHTWITFGPLTPCDREGWLAAVARQNSALTASCRQAGRDPATLRRSALLSLDLEWAQASPSAYRATEDALQEMGFTDLVVHWPRTHDPLLAGPTAATWSTIVGSL